MNFDDFSPSNNFLNEAMKQKHAEDNIGRFLFEFMQSAQGTKFMNLLESIYVEAPKLKRMCGQINLTNSDYQLGQADVYHYLKFRADQYESNLRKLGEEL